MSLNDLLKNIEQIGRFDVIDDLIPFFVNLANGDIKFDENELSRLNLSIDHLTIDDTPQHRIYYDAFVCYAPEDIQYAQELISIVKNNDERAKLATADVLLPGHFEHDALIRLIDERCKKVIIILTRNFISSKECEFQTKFANEVGIKAQYPKIIPILYEEVEEGLLPNMIQVLSKINMTTRSGFLWDMSVTKLLRSLELSTNNQHRQNRQECYATHFTADIQQSSGEPIVDLLHSQSSTNSNLLAIEDLRRTPSPSSNKGVNLFKSIKRKMMGSSTGATSSMMLISHDKNE